MGGHGKASPPVMRCYKPRMNESDLITTLERYVTTNGLRDTLRDTNVKQTKHSTRPLRGFNDVSRYTWSTIHPEGSELPPQRALNANETVNMSTKRI